MKGIDLLDCTLRDGGHVIGSRFGEKVIVDIISKLIQSRVDVIELGFLKEAMSEEGITVDKIQRSRPVSWKTE